MGHHILRPRILFRADAEKAVGTGDLLSLIYLSKEFKRNGWECHFAVRDHKPARDIIKNRALKNVHFIARKLSIKEEVDFLNRLCEKTGFHCLFFEVTKHGLSAYRGLRGLTTVKACVNFDGKITDDFNLVVNWCVESGASLYRKYAHTRAFTGFENIIMPDYFAWLRIERRKYRSTVRNILVIMGGFDEFNLGKRVIQFLQKENKKYNLRVILGSGYNQGKRQLERMAIRTGNITIKQNADNLLRDYLWADMAFATGGLTCSELVATRTPAIIIAAYEHQKKRCDYYARRGLVIFAGYHSKVGSSVLKRSFTVMQEKLPSFQRRLSRERLRGANEKIFEYIDSYR